MFEFLMCVWVFFLGAAMGSFYNVLIDRLPNDEDVIFSRSECTACHTKLKWYDLVPIFSFIFLKRKCRYCHQKLSFKYLLCELTVGSLFLLAFLLYGLHVQTLVIVALWSMLFVTGIMDFESGIVIDQVVFAFALIGLIANICSGGKIVQLLLGGATGLAFYGFIYFVARLIFRKEGFGSGDVVLLTGIGLFFNPLRTFLIGILAFYVCIIFIIIAIIKRKGIASQMAIPFAPPICISAFVMSIFGDQIVAFLNNLLRH